MSTQLHVRSDWISDQWVHSYMFARTGLVTSEYTATCSLWISNRAEMCILSKKEYILLDTYVDETSLIFQDLLWKLCEPGETWRSLHNRPQEKISQMSRTFSIVAVHCYIDSLCGIWRLRKSSLVDLPRFFSCPLAQPELKDLNPC